MAELFHVSPSTNRASIDKHGLDWTLMSDMRGIAGSTSPELEGIFVCRGRDQADRFLRMNNSGGPADVWAIANVDEKELVVSTSGYSYVPRPIPRTDLVLVERAVPAAPAGMTLAQRMTRPLR